MLLEIFCGIWTIVGCLVGLAAIAALILSLIAMIRGGTNA